MPLILNIETSTDICSVCLAKDNKILAIRETERSYSHSEVIAVFIEECVKEAKISMTDIEAVSISRGPGSYTALRIGASTAKGICFALSIPLIAIDTLDALRTSVQDNAEQNDLVIPMIDARRKEVYLSIYDHRGKVVKEVEPIILDENTFKSLSSYRKLLFCGDGAPKAKDILTIENSWFFDVECSSTYMVKLSEEKFLAKQFEDIAYYEPFYYKGPNITVQKKNILR
ncbi:MAG: tRNA (adenosine(37)-N6)-threonylcarbamoyltransferase complex dimerization subunit type 1 TsaB [Saprospiraceae bacterium]|nr:tRNA (adenosine(37)-N6)-threonylcarbamoyltransferase complex dimerization subunit type 1 TsaB [Saprospiraceae bacterium]